MSAHSMPFGAEIVGEAVRFRLWAPAAKQVLLRLKRDDGETDVPMKPLAEGWFETTQRANAGDRYRYCIDDKLNVPDPASRYNPDDVHGASRVVDPNAYAWEDSQWRGRPWEEAVIYEIHVGAFTPAGTFLAAIERLDYLITLGVTAIELMPVADFPGARNWGYDGVLPFAPDASYGEPDDLKRLVDMAHQKGLMVFLDVVYNHFGPEGNYLYAYAPQFFTDRHHTPWGAAINFDGDGSRIVRDFFIHNALYWLKEFHFDGLRFDAVHAIVDDSNPHILVELAAAVRNGPGSDRPIHLILENDGNDARYLQRDERGRPRWHTAQWNDDIHHAIHVLATGESDGYYSDYAAAPAEHLVRCLTQGFSYQGEASHFRQGVSRGEPSADLPPSAFVSFMQNHDQVGNRAFGDRLSMIADHRALRALTAILLLAPSPPLLFMGEEWGADEPFQFFCDFGSDLADAVTEGRRKEFARFARFSDAASREAIPDPNDAATFARSKLNWNRVVEPPHDAWFVHYRTLLALRREVIVPRLSGTQGGQANGAVIGVRGLRAQWRLGDGSMLTVVANLDEAALPVIERPAGEVVYASDDSLREHSMLIALPSRAVVWFMEESKDEG